MARKKGKLPALPNAGNVVMRSIALQQGVTDVVVATETPVQRYDEERGYVVNEVLLMDGVMLRANKDSMPIVDSHNDSTVRNILGSIQQLRIIDGELHGKPVFASDDEAQLIRQRMDEGHITDFSITALPIESVFIPRGQQFTTQRGQIIEGPAVIHTRWQPHNASICATGADEYSTVRRSYTDLNQKKVKRMDEALLGQLVEMGLPEGMTDPNQVLSWVVGKMAAPTQEAVDAAAPVESAITSTVENAEEVAEAPPADDEEKPDTDMAETERAITQRALKADADRRKQIRTIVERSGLPRAFADELCDGQVSVDKARERVLERMATKPIGQSSDIRVTESEDDKFYAAARDGLIMRAAPSAGRRVFAEGQKPAPGAEDFRRQSLFRIAETCLRRQNVNVERMAPKDIALIAMGHAPTMHRFRVERSEGTYHTTGSFPQLMADTANRSLLLGYEEAPFTWNQWARQGPSADDFRKVRRIRFSELSAIEQVPELGDYPEAKAGDEKEEYAVVKHGSKFSVSWETVVNDDLDALSRIPAMQGAQCRRKQNLAVYTVLTSNPTMADTGALFNSTAQTTAGGHANLAGSTGAPSVTTLNAGWLSMMTKTGITINGVAGPILSIMPRFLIVPAALAATAEELLGSFARPEVGGSAAGNSQTLNIYGPGGPRGMQLIVEPMLDASSTTAWYLAASNSQVDTVELMFLSGEESPVLENEWDMNKDAYVYKVRQTFGVAPIDFRGLYKNAG